MDCRGGGAISSIHEAIGSHARKCGTVLVIHPLKGGRFPVRLPKDEEGHLLVDEEDMLCFSEVHPGDHLFCPFQCELCHFRNMQGRLPMMGTGLLDDTELMKCSRRVNVDAFWSREPTIISQNLGKINRALKIAHGMGMYNPPMPKMGPWTLVDGFGAGAVAIMVKCFMDPGMTENYIV
jgi:hypothetical protein